MLNELSEHIDDIYSLRHILHMQPELSGQEENTAKILKNFLAQYNPTQLLTDVGGHGILAIFEGNEPGPCLAFRADMDALPIQEDSDLSYRSIHEGIGHMCGHDGHMAIVAGLASLIGTAPLAKGKVILLFQPSEETGQGAWPMTQSSAFQSLSIDHIFAFHNLPNYEKHHLICLENTFCAASVGMRIQLVGKTSHAAYPEQGASPALALTELIRLLTDLPDVFSQTDEFAMVTVTHAVLGAESFGITPGEATLMATLRSFSDQTLERLQRKTETLAAMIANTYDLELQTSWCDHFPTTVNAPESIALVREVASQGEIGILLGITPFRWSEDFGWYTKNTKGALLGIGSGNGPPLHSNNFDFPDDLIPTGIEVFYRIIRLMC